MQGDNILHRAKYSCVQNNVCKMHIGLKEEYQWLTDLQPLQEKDAKTLCHAMVVLLSDVLSLLGQNARTGSALPCPKRRFVHIVVCDSVATNVVAAKKLLHLVNSDCGPWNIVNFSLVLERCATHQANLVVRTTVLGTTPGATFQERQPPGRGTKFPTLTQACARSFMFLLADYLFSLRSRVQPNCEILGSTCALVCSRTVKSWTQPS